MASTLRQVLRSFPHLITAHQNNIRTLERDDILGMIMADGGYFDHLLKDESGCLKTVVTASPQRAQRLYRLETIIEQ